jgi:3-oxoacyl-[acyl-carrier protein] reductase
MKSAAGGNALYSGSKRNTMVTEKQTALITGASGGIGRAISLRLAKDGYHIIVNYHANEIEAQATASQIVNQGGSAELCPFDVSDRAATAAALKDVLAKHTLRVVILAAGVRHDEALVFMNDDQWDEVIGVNLNSFYAVVKPIVQQMLLNRDGRIIALSSTSGESGLAGQVNYAAAKAGVIGAIKSLALECAKRNVLVNAIAPGFIETGMLEGMDRKETAAAIPMKRLGRPDEVAAVASFLASADASYITGQVIRVNGGIYL